MVEPGILDRDRGLVGEGLEQGDLVVGPATVAAVVEAKQAERAIATDERDQARGADGVARVGDAHLAGCLVRVGVADRIRTPIADSAVADRVGAHS